MLSSPRPWSTSPESVGQWQLTFSLTRLLPEAALGKRGTPIFEVAHSGGARLCYIRPMKLVETRITQGELAEMAEAGFGDLFNLISRIPNGSSLTR